MIINTEKIDLVYNPSKLTIPCPICGQEYHRVGQHAKAQHDLPTDEFRKIYHYTTAPQAAAYRLLKLYGGRGDRYIEQLYAGKGKSSYVTVDANEPWVREYDRYLGVRKVTSHLYGSHTYGVTFHDYTSKVFVFDFDFFFTSPDNQKSCVYGLVDVLNRAQIPLKQIHLLKSGLKGYHIDLYFDRRMPISALLSFASWAVHEANLEGLEPHLKVEFRPEKVTGGRGVRLPLGIHQSTGERMVYLNTVSIGESGCTTAFKGHESLFEPVLNQLEYLLYQTHQISGDDFFKYVYPIIKVPQKEIFLIKSISETKRILPTKPPVTRRYTRDELKDLYENGLKHRGTRHHATLGMAIKLKEEGKGKQEVIRLLEQWSKNKTNGASKSTFQQRKDDVARIVDYVFLNDCHLEAKDDLEWLLTDTDVTQILNYHYLTLAEQKTLAIFFMLRRHFGKDAYYPQELIANLASVNVRTVRNHITKLIKLGILRLTYQGNLFNMHSNKYQIRDYQDGYVVGLSFAKADLTGEAFVKAMKSMVSEEFIRARYSYYLRTVRIQPVQRDNCTIKFHPSIPSPQTPLPQIKITTPQKKLVGRKIFEALSPIVAVFRFVRSFKKKHGAAWTKKIFRLFKKYNLKC